MYMQPVNFNPERFWVLDIIPGLKMKIFGPETNLLNRNQPKLLDFGHFYCKEFLLINIFLNQDEKVNYYITIVII